MSNDSVKKIHLNDKGFIAFDVIPGKKYKWMMHESQEWFDKAKKIQGSDWYWNDPHIDVEYVFDSFGFRNHKELEEIVFRTCKQRHNYCCCCCCCSEEKKRIFLFYYVLNVNNHRLDNKLD